VQALPSDESFLGFFKNVVTKKQNGIVGFEGSLLCLSSFSFFSSQKKKKRGSPFSQLKA
jgi:hypothetical protein